MKKSKLLIIISTIAVLTVSFTVYAAAADTKTAKNIRSFFGIDTSKLTEQQKSDLNSSVDKMTQLQKDTAQKMADLQKETVNKMVTNGSMTKEQGDAAIKRIEDELKRAQEKGFDKGFGMGMRGMDGPETYGIDVSKLTDVQKSDLKDILTKMAALQKDTVNIMVSNGTITKEQGDSSIKKIDEMVQKFTDNDFSKCQSFLKGGFGVFGNSGFDYTKLTEQQKTDLKNAFTKMAQLQKEAITKMVSNGAITQEQADTANKRIDNELNNFGTNGFPMGHGMGRHGNIDKSKSNDSSVKVQ